MISNVQFPGLGLELEVNRVAMQIFGIDIYWYGILIALGMLLGFMFAIWKSRSFGVDDDRLIDVIFVCAIAGIIGARVFYVIFAPFKYDSIWQMIDFRDGGLAIYGTVIAAFITAIFMCKWRKVPLLPALDIASMGFLIGQSIGRWGNFVNQEAFGTNTNLPWGMISENTTNYLTYTQQTLADAGITVDPNLPVHPTFLYESLWCALGFVVLFLYSKKRKFNGEITLLYIIWYGAERAIVEGLRTDSLNTIFGIRISQAIAIVSCLIAFVIWFAMRKKYAGKPLYVSYDFKVYPKQKNTPIVNLTWKASDNIPTTKEIVNVYKWTSLPVGVWHVNDNDGADK